MDPDTVQATATTPEQSAPNAPLPVPELPPRVLIDLVTDCNLKCPMCIVHGGTDDPRLQGYLKQSMSIDNSKRILDEVMAARPLVMPSMWSEPTMSPTFREQVKQIKAHGVTVEMNTKRHKLHAG